MRYSSKIKRSESIRWQIINTGKITQIIGAVLDIKFSEGKLPEINEAIKIATK